MIAKELVRLGEKLRTESIRDLFNVGCDGHLALDNFFKIRDAIVYAEQRGDNQLSHHKERLCDFIIVDAAGHKAEARIVDKHRYTFTKIS